MKRHVHSLDCIAPATLELVARRLRALADASRLSVLRCLCRGERSVTELVDETKLAQANVSKHLRVLRDEGLVTARRDRRNVRYRLSSRLPEKICEIVCSSMERDAAARRRLLDAGSDRREARRAG